MVVYCEFVESFFFQFPIYTLCLVQQASIASGLSEPERAMAPQISADQLTLSHQGGKLSPPQYYLSPPPIFRLSYVPEASIA